MAAECDIITQRRMQLEDFEFMDFFKKVIEDYDFKWTYPYFSNIRSRTVCYGRGTDEHVTDDAIHQLLVQDVLVAMVYERRTEFNFIEATYVVIAKGIRKAKHRLQGYNKTFKHNKELWYRKQHLNSSKLMSEAEYKPRS